MSGGGDPSLSAARRRYALVLNPHAGGGLALRLWPDLERELRRRNLPFELIREETGAAALARVLALPPDVAVLSVGGDGTVGALLPAIVGTGRPLGLIPLGTGNDFAGMLKMSPSHMSSSHFGAALDRLVFQPRAVDALDVQIDGGDEAGGRYVLLNGLGMGFDAQVAATMSRAPARLQGFARYLWSALATLRTLSLATVTVTVDGQVLHQGPSALVAAMNGTRYGGGFLISPWSNAQDGLLNVLASGPVTRLQLLGLMARVVRGAHLGHPKVHHAAGRRVEVVWDRPTDLHLDGDLHGRVTRLTARVLPGAVHLLTG